MSLTVAVRWTASLDSLTYTLPDVVAIDINKGEGLESNAATIELRNDITQFRPYNPSGVFGFNTEQPIDIFVRYDTDGAGLDSYNFDYLLFSGRVVEFECVTEENSTKLTLKCADSSYIALNRIWLGVETGTPPALIKKVVDFVNQNIADPNKRVVALIEKSVTAISTAGVVTATAHGLNNGEPVVLYDTNSTPSADGRWLVANKTADTFQLKSRVTGAYASFSVAGTSGTIGGIQALNSEGAAYTATEISKTSAPAYEILKELSQTGFTLEETSVPNRFHVDKWNSLRWFYPSDTVRHIIAEGQTSIQGPVSYFHPVVKQSQTFSDTRAHKVVSVKMTYAVYDIVNFIIYKAGQDLDNNQIQFFAYKDGSGTPVNKDAFIPWEDISRELKRRETAIGNLTFSKNDEYTIAVSSGTTSWGQAYSSSSDYKAKFILEAQRLAQARAQAIFDKTGNPRWQGSVELIGEHSFDVNDALLFTSARHGIRNVYMRVTDVKHNIRSDGWFTTLGLKEEVPRGLIA